MWATQHRDSSPRIGYDVQKVDGSCATSPWMARGSRVTCWIFTSQPSKSRTYRFGARYDCLSRRAPGGEFSMHTCRFATLLWCIFVCHPHLTLIPLSHNCLGTGMRFGTQNKFVIILHHRFIWRPCLFLDPCWSVGGGSITILPLLV